MVIEYKPIGIIHSPYTDVSGMPIQPVGARGIDGTIDIFPEYVEGLKDLDGFSHIILLYQFHLTREGRLILTPFLDSRPRGVFATRAPGRPNPIGFSIVKLVKVEKNIIHIENVDIVDGTPLLDIKPYIPDTDCQDVERMGWLEGKTGRFKKEKSDDRFHPKRGR